MMVNQPRQPLVSIIVPVYKAENYLDRCVQSIIDQSYSHLEIILIDDGSPDRSGKMCDEWLKKEDRIKVIHLQNGGPSRARNIGIENSTGNYICFIDSDDWVDTDHVESFFIENYHEYDVIFCGIKEEYDHCTVDIKVDKTIVSESIVEPILRHEQGLSPFYNQTKIIKASILKDYHVRFREDLRVLEDTFFVYSLSKFTNKVAFIGESHYHHMLYSNTGFHLSSISSIESRYAIGQELKLAGIGLSNQPAWESYLDAMTFGLLNGAISTEMESNPKPDKSTINHYLCVAKEILYRAGVMEFVSYSKIGRLKYILGFVWPNYYYRRLFTIYTKLFKKK